MPDNNRIITTIAVQENPRISQSATTAIKTFSIDDRNKEIDRYWKNADNFKRRRKLFPIEFWQLDGLIKKTGKVALIVKNIHKPDKVTAKWATFNPEKPPTLNENSFCFVLSQPYYSGIVEVLNLGTVSHSIGGLAKVKQDKMSSNFIVALLGKNDAGEYTLYLQNASANLIEEDSGENFDTSPGGEGTGGVKLPL